MNNVLQDFGYAFRTLRKAPTYALTAGDAADLGHNDAIFQEAATYQFRDLNLSRSGEVDTATGFLVTPNLFQLLGVGPEHGRTFTADEGRPGRDQAILLSHSFWERRFGGDPAVIGSTISVDGINSTVVGVMPHDFNYPTGAEVWKPLAMTSEVLSDRTKEALSVVARLAPGISFRQASSRLDAV